MTTQLEFNLNEALQNPSKAKEIVGKVQQAFTDLSNSNLQSLEAAKQAQALVEAYENQVKVLTQGTISLSDSLKNVHLFFNSKKELWQNDKEVVEFMQHLSTWVVSSGAIKLGVLSESN